MTAAVVQQAIYAMGVKGKEQVDAASRAVDGLSVSEEKLTRATRASEQGFERLLGRLDPATRAYQQYQRTVEAVQKYEAAGIGTVQQRSHALSIATANYQKATGAISGAAAANDNFAKATGLSSFHVTNLGYQLQDIASGLAMGQSPFTILAQQGSQVYQVLASSERGVGGALKGIGEQLLALLTPGRAIVLGFTAAAAAVYGFYRVFRTEGPSVEESLEEQARLIGIVKNAYSDATRTQGRFLEQSRQITTLQAQQNILALQQQLSQSTRASMKGLTRPTSVPSEIPMEGVAGAIVNAEIGATRFRELNTEIDRFNASTQSASDVQAFRDAVASIGVAAAATNPELARSAAEALASTKAMGEMALATLKAEAALRVLQGTASKADLDLLGIKTATTVNSYERLIQRTKDRVAELKLEAQTAGQASDAVLRLRLQHEAERAAKEAGAKVNQKVLDQLKEELAVNSRLAAQARLRSDIAFERNTMFLDPAEQQIAGRLRPLYGDDLSKSLSSTEAELLRVNARLEEGRHLATEFASGFAQDMRNGVSQVDALNSALGRMRDRLINLLIDKSVANIIGGLSGGFNPLAGAFSFGSKSANGNVFSNGRVQPFAMGGVISSPTIFPMASGMGLAGEAGEEGILPLRRGPGGRLGVESYGGGRVVNNIQIVNNSSARVREEHKPNQTGGTDIRVMIDDMAAELIASGSSRTNQALERRYGVDRTAGMT